MADRTCKRCSIDRVNTLVAAYHRAFTHQEAHYREGLQKIVHLVRSRGYEGGRILSPGLSDEDLRSHCWNLSSFLEDDEVKRILT